MSFARWAAIGAWHHPISAGALVVCGLLLASIAFDASSET